MSTKRSANKFTTYSQDLMEAEQAELRSDMAHEKRMAILNDTPKFSMNEMLSMKKVNVKMLPWYFLGGFVCGCLLWSIATHYHWF